MADHREREPDAFLEELANDLMQAIGRTLNQSEQVQELLARIHTHGYQVAVVLAALTQLAPKPEADPPAEAKPEPPRPSPEVATTPFDRAFLRQAGIKDPS